jgi:Domain of unknown function (DUF4180)
MSPALLEIHGVRVFACAADGEKLRGERDALQLMSEAYPYEARLLLVPACRFDDDFFRLNTRLAGEFIQKLVNYRMRLAIVGDISRHVEESTALRDFIVEANRGAQVWFVANRQELERRLARERRLVEK